MNKFICKYCGREFSRKESCTFHEKYCKLNPSREIFKSHSASVETREKISKSMKKAHAEGRAHNIGECRWNNKPSYPEKWVMDVLESELNQKNNIDYIREFPFYNFSLDFAWPNKKFCIEIDGEQHQTDTNQNERDIKKDSLLKEDGWKELRVQWKNIFNNPKLFIEILKDCFENLRELTEEEKLSLEKYKSKKQQRLDFYEKNNILKDKSGKHNFSIISEEEWNRRLDLIKKENVDINKYGWKIKLSRLSGMSEASILNTLDHFNISYYKHINSEKIKGSKNGSFGTFWITDGVSSKKLKEGDVIPSGWRKGRII